MTNLNIDIAKPRRIFAVVLVAAASSLLVVGCGKALKPVYPVKGRVVAGASKKPAVGALLFFHAVDPERDYIGNPMGQVTPEGDYALTTRTTGDGAPAGEYVSTITWEPTKKTLFDADEGDRLKGAFADPKTSKLRYTVQAGASNEVPVIELP